MRFFSTIILFVLSLGSFTFAKDNKFLSKVEIEYLKNNSIVRMCNNPNWAPIEFANNDSFDDMQGIAIDNLKLIERNLNLKFINVPTSSWKESLQFLKEKKCDILPAAVKTKERSKYANFTKSYLNLPLAIFTQKDKKIVSSLDEIMDKTWTRQKGSGLITKLKEKYPNLKVLEVKGDKEALQYVNSGKVYFTIATLPVASHNISKYSLNDLHIAGYTKMSYDISIAVRDDYIVLLNILNKSLSSISENESLQIFRKWVSPIIKEAIPDYSVYWKSTIIFIFLLSIILYRQYELRKINKRLRNIIKEKTKKLKLLNKNLEKKVEKSVHELRVKDKMLNQQAKMASMGEMLANIAHQWRQPLSVISTATSGIKLQKELDNLTEKSHNQSLDSILLAVKQLSSTIEDFRNFFSVDKKLVDSNLKSCYEKTLVLLQASLKNQEINIISNIDENINIMILENELMHVLINILNNAKDALTLNNIDKKYIFVDIYKDKNSIFIKIKDNAKGIDKSILEKIFNPYFTTKEDHNGTGLGLYMSKQIIEKNIGGRLTVENYEYEYQNMKYIGACFIIEFRS